MGLLRGRFLAGLDMRVRFCLGNCVDNGKGASYRIRAFIFAAFAATILNQTFDECKMEMQASCQRPSSSYY